MIESWKHRYTARQFDTNYIPDEETISNIADCIPYVPSQNGTLDHYWIVLGPDDKHIKQWLVDNIYYTYDEGRKHTEYFTMLMDAPYVFHSFRALKPELNVSHFEVVRNNSFHAGVIVSEALNAGLDVAQICCTQGLYKEYGKGKQKPKVFRLYKKILSEFFTDLEEGYEVLDPMMCVAVGKALPLTQEHFKQYNDGVTFTGKKTSKKNNLLRRGYVRI